MKKIIQINRFMVMCVAMLTLSLTNAFATDYTSLFSINCTSVVTGGTYQAYTATVDQRGWVITFGGGSNYYGVGTNSGNRSKCVLGDTYAKYAITNLVSKTDIATAFVSTTSISDVSKISYTFNGGSNQTATKVYLIYSSNNTTFDTIPLISGTQGAAISSGTAYEFAKKTGYFGLLFKCTNSTGNWRIDQVNITFYKEAGPDMHDFLYFVGLNGNDTVKLNKVGSKDLANLTATFEYSTDRTTWNNYTWPDNSGKGGYAIALENAGDTVFFRAKGTNGKNATVGLNVSTNFTFAFGADDQIAAGGNIMSLYDATCEQDTMTECGFYKLFNGAKRLVTAPKLPAKKMATNCYSYIFNGCSSLIAAPELKATTLEAKCYAYMFQNCSTLQVDTCADDAQCTGALLVVPATGAANWNYKMFAGCKGDAKYTAQTGIQLGGHYCIKEYVAVITGVTLTGFNAAYDGENHSVQVSGTIAGDVIEFSGDSTNWQSTNPSFKGVVDTLIYVRVQRAGYQDWGGKATIKITARAITMTSASDSKQFDGDPLTNANVSITDGSLAGSDAVSYTVTGSQTAVGSSPNSFTYEFTTGSASNYEITKVEGTLEVTAAPGPVVETYGRKLKTAGSYGTICLAKKFTSMEGVEGLYKPATKDASKLYCEEVELKDVKAGYAYIFKANADSVTFVLDGEAVPGAIIQEGEYLFGSLVPDYTLAEESDFYGLSGNTIIKLAVGSTIKQNCAVIDLESVPAATPAPSRRYVAFGYNGTNTTTGLNQLTDSPVNRFTKMMINGQLIIIRDGKKYNAQGQQL